MILVFCSDCHHMVRIMGVPEEVDTLVGSSSPFWPDKFPCVYCSKHGPGFKEHEVDESLIYLSSVMDLTPQEAFLAFNGMGLPRERSCSGEVVQELFTTPVRRAVGKDSKTGRFVLEHLEFWDGTKMYFGAAPDGAIVYRIARPHSYTREALNE